MTSSFSHDALVYGRQTLAASNSILTCFQDTFTIGTVVDNIVE